MANVKTVKMKILRACYIRGVVRKVGDVVALPENEAKEICWMKKGEIINPEPATPPAGKAPAAADKKEKGGDTK